ncbi:MAG: glucosaminidase domain-containing protein [Tidjanibacter sp.]|nr:glucosaminidase domain-containing protein [Tidjanibacter sp.]
MTLAKKILLAGAAVVMSLTMSAQQTITRAEYIEMYAPLAVEQQTLYGIPASITLAQGLLESANGNSRLAREANNHFGIKCGASWDGKSIRHDDDALQECFRAYSSPEESYIDHSLILSERKWYRPLFDLDPMDYKAWAHGLKKAGYATNPRYADLLIKIIEDNNLHRFDTALIADWKPTEERVEESSQHNQEVATEDIAEPTEEPAKPRKINIDTHKVALHSVGGYALYAEGGRRFIVVGEGEELATLAKVVGVSERRLRKINHLPANHTTAEGERIFLE